ncbi:MAG: hypothetical protein AAFV45_05865 [Pseudomonadota bacterium]
MAEPLFVPDTTGLSDAEARMVRDAHSGRPCSLNGAQVGGRILVALLTGERADWSVGGDSFYLRDAVIEGGCDLAGASLATKLLFDNVTFRVGPGRLPVQRERAAGTVRVTETGRQSEPPGRASITLIDGSFAGLSLRGCRLDGALAADGASFSGDVHVEATDIAGGAQFSRGRITGSLRLTHSHLNCDDDADAVVLDARDDHTSLDARGITVGGGVLLDATTSRGRVSFQDAHVTGPFSAVGFAIPAGVRAGVPSGEPALSLKSACIGRNVDLSQMRLAGALELALADVAQDVALDGLTCDGEKSGISANRLHVGGGVAGRDIHLTGSIDLSHAKIGKDVQIAQSVFGDGSVGLLAEQVSIGGSLDIDTCKAVGCFILRDASVSGRLRLCHSRVYGGLFSVISDACRIGSDAYFSRSFFFGLVRLNNSRIGGSLIFSGACVKAEEDGALSAVACSVGRDVLLNDGFQATGGVHLVDSKVQNRCDVSGGRFMSAALARDGRPRRADLNALLSPDANLADAGTLSSVCGPDADEIALGFGGLTAGQLIFGAAEADRPVGIVDLRWAQVDKFIDTAAVWAPPFSSRATGLDGRDLEHWKLDGFVYQHLVNPTGEAGSASPAHSVSPPPRSNRSSHVSVAARRTAWLMGQHPEAIFGHLVQQPWQQLEDGLRRAGLTSDANDIAMAQQSLRSSAATASFVARLSGGAHGLLTGHGYRPLRGLIWLFVACCMMAGVAQLAASQCAVLSCKDQSVYLMTKLDGAITQSAPPKDGTLAPHATSTPTPESAARSRLAAYPAFNPVLYAVDVVVPAFSMGQREHWRPNPDWLPLSVWSEGAAPVTGEQGAKPDGVLPRASGGRFLFVIEFLMQAFGIVIVLMVIIGISQRFSKR